MEKLSLTFFWVIFSTKWVKTLEIRHFNKIKIVELRLMMGTGGLAAIAWNLLCPELNYWYPFQSSCYRKQLNLSCLSLVSCTQFWFTDGLLLFCFYFVFSHLVLEGWSRDSLYWLLELSAAFDLKHMLRLQPICLIFTSIMFNLNAFSFFLILTDNLLCQTSFFWG